MKNKMRKIGAVLVQSGVPIPAQIGNGLRSKWPLVEMAVGESFEVVGKLEAASLRSTITRVTRRTGMTFKVLMLEKAGGVAAATATLSKFRCWRVS